MYTEKCILVKKKNDKWWEHMFGITIPSREVIAQLAGAVEYTDGFSAEG